MSDVKLGELVDASAQRDAVHVAIAPVIAVERLHPGQHIGFITGNKEKVGSSSLNLIGVVDPFLKEDVLQGQRFWIFLYPKTITSLRHDWSHPAFSATDLKEDAEKRIREIAAICDMGYDMLMNAAGHWLAYGDYTTQHGYESWRDNFPAYAEEFWKLYSQVTGATVPEDKRENFFSCSC